ncbi:MAG: FAD:protein FMN transferase [Candidatus Omnitrophica bacterium]|nr:FAD:protein FMN transferase [Candidatus Omnitrophota bacterium]
MKKLKIVLIIIIAVFAGLWSIRLYNSRRFHLEKETRFMMDTYVTLYAIGPKEITSHAISLALNRMEEIAVKFNALDSRSPIYAFNKNGEALSDSEIVALVRRGLEISKQSKGAFDMTIAPLLELWGFYDKSFRVPQEEEIKDCLKDVGYQHLFIDNGLLKKDAQGVMIDLGGIAKGYALAEAAKVLKNAGVVSAVIDAGGDVLTLGKKAGRLWKVGIRDPRGEGIIGYVEVEDLAVIGSGDYERFFIKDGKRYCHIFNAKTGYPAQGIASVTLIYPDPVIAQPWAKIPFIMGAKKGLEVLEKIPGLEVIIITTSGEKIYSPGLRHALNVVSETNKNTGGQ